VSLRNLQLETEPSVSNFLVPPKFGYPGLAADLTLALSSLWPQLRIARKTASPAGKLKELHKRGKK